MSQAFMFLCQKKTEQLDNCEQFFEFQGSVKY